MTVDSWLPVKFGIPNGPILRRAAAEGDDWQIYETADKGRALVARSALAKRWIQSGLITDTLATQFQFSGESFHALISESGFKLAAVGQPSSPRNKVEALACADSLRVTREIDPETSLHDAIYVEKISRLLPTYTLSPHVEDEIVFGTWLSDGVPVSVNSFRRLKLLAGWLSEAQLVEVVEKAGYSVAKTEGASRRSTQKRVQTREQERQDEPAPQAKSDTTAHFELAGRPELQEFFAEHVIDIIENGERYKALGIEFPSAVILHGPPGCGKTFAVEKLVEYLGWPCFEIEASSVASPFIHETSKKVAEVFDQALKNSPSVLVIDEMEAFLADRQMGGGSSHHRVEEVAEFLRRIPEAIKNRVLIIAMTNRIDMIDPAILRRGRFDHVVKVDMASKAEVLALLTKLVGDLPCDGEISLEMLASSLEGRPLSDVAFVVREAARLAARSGKTKIAQTNLHDALDSSPVRDGEGGHRRIGFL